MGNIFIDKNVPNGKDRIKVEELELKKGELKARRIMNLNVGKLLLKMEMCCSFNNQH